MGDFKFISFLVLFMALIYMFGYYAFSDITNPQIQDNINFSNSVDGEASYSSYKTGLLSLTGSDLIIVSMVGLVLTSILGFVALRYVRGQ